MLLLFPLDWRLTMLRASIALLFGVLTLLWPGLTLLALVFLFGAYVLIDGVLTLVDVIRGEPEVGTHRGMAIFEGVTGVVAGVITFAWPSITALALLFLIAFWAILVGGARIWLAVEARRALPHAWLFGLGGALSIVFGALLLITPGAGALVITWLIGWYAIVISVLLFALAWRARDFERTVNPRGTGSIRGIPA